MTEQGWNDPPTLAFENTPKTGANKLTKHPRYSADRAPTTSTHPPPQATLDVTSGPPPTLNISSPPQKEGSCNTKADVDANNDFGAVVQLLEKQVNDLQDTLQGRTCEEVRRRLEVLSKQWVEGRLSREVQAKMAELATALRSGDYSKADGIHVALMVDHVAEVSQWMVGIKKLIVAVRAHAGES